MLWSLLLGLILSIVKDVYFPDPNIVSGSRFDGGADINPNTVGVFALLSIFWAHYTALQDKHWYRVNKFTWAFGIYVLLLSGSRGNLITLGIVYVLYLLVWGGQILIKTVLLKSKTTRSIIRPKIAHIIGAAVVICTLIVVANRFMSTSNFDFLVERIGMLASEVSGDEGGGRLHTWKILLDQVNDSNFWFGSTGWWYSGVVMKNSHYSDLAIHAHNTYLRLLIEVGFIGLIAVLLLPIYLFFVQIQMVIRSSRYGWTHELKISTLLLAMLLALLVQQNAYQTYMTGTGSVGYGSMVFVLVLVYHDFSEKIIKKSDHAKVTQKSIYY